MLAADVWWSHAVDTMSWMGLAVGLAPGAFLLALLIRACTSHRTCRPTRLFGIALARRQDSHDSLADCSADTSYIVRRLAVEESLERRQGHGRKANFLASVSRRLDLQLKSVALQAKLFDAEEKQLSVDAQRASWALAHVDRARVEGAPSPGVRFAARPPEANEPKDLQAQYLVIAVAALTAAWVLVVCVAGIATAADN